MTIKEIILDCLADGPEDEDQVKLMLEKWGIFLSYEEIRNIFSELTVEQLIYVNSVSVSSIHFTPNVNWYLMTEKGRKFWEENIYEEEE